MRTCILIPTYNESKLIASLIAEIRKQCGLDILVVDDGSKDNTAAIARRAGAIVLENSDNKGKGVALRRGFDYISKSTYDAVITMDGDGQHHPADISSFIQAAQESSVGMVLGNRMGSSKDMPAVRWFTNKFTSLIISCLSNQKVSDSQCGFRLIKISALRAINLYSLKYEIESELIIRIARLGMKINSVPIQTIYRGEKSQINPVKDALRFLVFIFKETFNFRH